MTEAADYITKLVHPILEIRERAISSLLQKVELKLVTSSGLGQYPGLVPNLLKLMNLGPHTLRSQVLSLLFFILKDEAARREFESLNGTQYLRSLKATVPLDLLPDINHLLQTLHQQAPQSLQEIVSESPNSGQDEPEDEARRRASFSKVADASAAFWSPDAALAREESVITDGVSVESFCEISLHEHSCCAHQERPVIFTTFPWQALTNTDRRVLDSTAQSLLSSNEAVVVASSYFLDTVVLKDFPSEIFLQRPAILKAMYGCIEEEGENAWHIQGPACNCLLTLTQLLNTRVAHFLDPHLTPGDDQRVTPTSSRAATSNPDISRGSCCPSRGSSSHNLESSRRFSEDGRNRIDSVMAQELSNTTIHEDDDGDEFILLGLHQLTVSEHCCQSLRVVSPLLASSRPALQATSLSLFTSTLTLLRRCVRPGRLWEEEEEELEDNDVLEIRRGIRRVVRIICQLITANYEAKKTAVVYNKAEKHVWNIQCLALLLSRIFKDFIPPEASSQVIDGHACEGLLLVLCDGGFYLEHKTRHDLLLQHLSYVWPVVSRQIHCVLFAARSLEAAVAFLRTTSAELDQLLYLAEKAMAVASIHQSSVLVEKLVRGLAKQVALGNVNEDQLGRARSLLLKVLQCPDDAVRLSGYKSVQRLVEDSVGISQAADTATSRSARILLILSPTIIRFLVYSGLVDVNSEVVEVARDTILGLLHGQPLMSAPVWGVAVECWRACLMHLQCLAESSTNLGRSVANLPSMLYGNDRDLQNIEVLKYHLRCLYLRDRETRIQSLCRVLQRLATTAVDFHPDPQDFHLAVHQDLFIVKHPIHLLVSSNMASEKGRLVKVLELLQGERVDAGVRKAVWAQLAFLLEDPRLHPAFLELCSLRFILMNFTSMMKRDGSQNLTVECLPGAVETLRLLVTHSPDIRKTLLQDEEFLLCVVRAALLYYSDERTRSQASCLMSLLLFNDIIRFTSHEEETKQHMVVGGKDFAAVPELLPLRAHLPFICDTYSWSEEDGLCPEMRTVHQLLVEKDWQVLKFLKEVWTSACAGGIEHLDSALAQASKFSSNLQLNKKEAELLKLSVWKLVMRKLLKNIENATSHSDVKLNTNTLSFYVQLPQFALSTHREVFSSAPWNQSLQRFLTARPNSSVDEQLLTHVLNCLSVCLTVYIPVLGEGKEICPPFLRLLFIEFKNENSAFHQILQSSGGTVWVASDPNPRALLSVRLFRAVTRLAIHVLKFASLCTLCNREIDEASWNQLGASVTASLLPVLSANNELKYYNLAILECALECLVQVLAVGWPGEQHAYHLISSLIRLISSFHAGRGRAHNSYMGRMITHCSSMALLHLLSHPSADLTQIVSWWASKEDLPDWSWLVSLWVYRDPSVTSSGLSVATVLASKTCGQNLLHDNLKQVTGGLWGASLSCLLAVGRSCLVRTSAAQLLINLASTRPTSSSPWTYPVVADTLTRETVVGFKALMALLEHCDFYKVVCSSLGKLHVPHEHRTVTAQPMNREEWDLSLSQLSTFYTPEHNLHNCWGSSQGNSLDDGAQSAGVSVQLYEALLRLLINILLLKPSKVNPQLCSHNIITLVIKQLRFIACQVKTSELHLRAAEASLVLIAAVLKQDPQQAMHLGRDTSLVHLTLVLLTSGTERTSVSVVSLEVLNALVCGGGWGASCIVQWIVCSPVLTLQPLIAGLHASSTVRLQAAASSFMTNLLQHVYNSDTSVQLLDLLSSVSGVLDEPVELLTKHKVCPGWELSRHIIQLICGPTDTRETPKLNGQTVSTCKMENLHMELEVLYVLLDCLKMLLLVSESSKEAAYHFRLFLLPVLTKPLDSLRAELNNININITSQLTKKKQVRENINKVIHNLEIATNWVASRGRWVETVGEAFIPLLHPLWIPALRTPPLLEALLNFMLISSAHHKVCIFLTRTSGLPGVLLSASRTKRPLLSCVTVTVCQQLANLQHASSSSYFKDLCKNSFLHAVSILIHCAKVQECVFVMNKHDIVNSSVKWLEQKVATEEGMIITSHILKLLVVLTLHQESQILVCKSNNWTNTVHSLLLQDGLQLDALRLMANMSLNHHAVHSLLASGGVIKTVVSMIGQCVDKAIIEVALVIVWAVVSNNQRGQALMKQHPIQPLLKHLLESEGSKEALLSQKILDILS